MTIGNNIQYYRKKKSLTQKELSEQLGVAVGTIQQYELDKREPKYETVLKLAKTLNTSAGKLYGIPHVDLNFEEVCELLGETTSFFNYLSSMGYEVYENPHENGWVIHISDTNEDLYLSVEELNDLERNSKENIEGRIYKLLKEHQ